MIEPRLEETAGEFERELLAAGTSYRVSAETRAKTLHALGLASVTAGAAAGLSAAEALSSSASSTAASSTATWWSKLGLGGLGKSTVVSLATVGALVGGPAAYLALTDDGGPQGTELSSPTARTGTPSKPSTVESPQGQPSLGEPSQGQPSLGQPSLGQPSQGPSSGEDRSLPTELPAREAPAVERSATLAPSSANGAPAARAAEASPAPASARNSQPKAESRTDQSAAALRAELQAVDSARATLASGNPQGALALLDAYDRGYPRGLLKLEAEVVRIDALARSGQTDAARRRADAFLRQHPKSVLASRVRRYAAP